MRDMTEEEYAALDKRLTDTIPTLGHNGTGFFSRKDSQDDSSNANKKQKDSIFSHLELQNA